MRKKLYDVLGGIGMLGRELRSLVTFNFFIAFSASAVAFLIPIETYRDGANLTKVILLGIVFMIPMLFGWLFGKWFDKKGVSLFMYGLLTFGFLLLSLVFLDSYLWKVVVLFTVGLVTELLNVGSEELVSIYTNREHYGRMTGVVRSMTTIGTMMGPIVIGTMIDSYGGHVAFMVNGILMIILAGIFYFLVTHGFLKKNKMSM